MFSMDPEWLFSPDANNDESIDELYYYLQEEDALYHIRLFNNDDSGLYKRVEVVECIGSYERLVHRISL